VYIGFETPLTMEMRRELRSDTHKEEFTGEWNAAHSALSPCPLVLLMDSVSKTDFKALLYPVLKAYQIHFQDGIVTVKKAKSKYSELLNLVDFVHRQELQLSEKTTFW
jgi:hypothetical protein